MTKIKNDPENYYKLSEPFESSDACNEALTKFHEELSELRKKYKIRDLLVVTYGSVKYEDPTFSFPCIANRYRCLRLRERSAFYSYCGYCGDDRERNA